MIIVIITALPGAAIPRIPAFFDLFKPDKIIHLFVFAVYVFLQIRGFRMQTTWLQVRKNAVLAAFLIGMILSAGTELLQYFFIPMRTASIYDFIANMAGCILGMLASGRSKTFPG